MKNLTNLLLAWMAALSAVYAQGDLKIDTIFSEYTTAHGHSYIKYCFCLWSSGGSCSDGHYQALSD